MGKKNSINKKAVINFLENNAIIIILVVLVIFVGISKDNFISKGNFKNIAVNTSVRFIIALGVSAGVIA